MISILRLLTRNPDNLIDSSKESFQYEIFKVHSRTVLSVPLCSAKSPLRKVLGGHLLSRSVSRQVSSAGYGLTVVFGMGTGVSHNRNTTGNCRVCIKKHEGFDRRSAKRMFRPGFSSKTESGACRAPRELCSRGCASLLNHSIVKQSLLSLLERR